MPNEKKKEMSNSENYDYRFINYRLDQLELNVIKGQEKLEWEYKESNKQVLRTLGVMQEGVNQQNETLIELSQRMLVSEKKLEDIDKIKKYITKHQQQIRNFEHRLDIYKQLLIGVGVGVGVALLMGLIKLI